MINKTKTEPIVSIITPCYNSQDYIEETIQSVLDQTYQHWELIICDDCSTDNSAKIIQSYVATDSRIKYLKTSKSSGSPTLPRNVAIKFAVGKYIAFLDSDDLWYPHKLDRQVEILESNKNAAIVFSFYEKINESGQRRGRIIKSPDTINYKQLLYGNVIGCLTGMYDTTKVGKILLRQTGHEDYVMWLSILKHGYIAKNTNDVQAMYRIRSGSISSNKIKVLKWQWEIYRNIENLGLLKSVFYFCCYVFNGLIKAIK